MRAMLCHAQTAKKGGRASEVLERASLEKKERRGKKERIKMAPLWQLSRGQGGVKRDRGLDRLSHAVTCLGRGELREITKDRSRVGDGSRPAPANYRSCHVEERAGPRQKASSISVQREDGTAASELEFYCVKGLAQGGHVLRRLALSRRLGPP